VLLLAAAVLQGCAAFAYTNVGRDPALRNAAPNASFTIVKRDKTAPRVLVLLALSGGGSRAAYFSARTMLALEDIRGPQGTRINALKEVDLISSVSGGSLAAAYYASSYDPGAPNPPAGSRVWNERAVGDLMRRDYVMRWLGNWFWPYNIARFWFTSFTRTDIMAQTFADNLFDRTHTGVDLLMGDLNPARPNLVLNATIGSRSYDDLGRAKTFGTVFTFTHEDFARKVNSDIARYELARAVMASATFPAVFSYMHLGDHYERYACPEDGKPCSYVHVFDGGTSDNLGLLSVKRVLLANGAAALRDYARVVVILVDAYRPSLGADPRSPDTRGAIGHVVDTNFLDATDSLLEANRRRLLGEFFSRSIAGYATTGDCYRDNLPDDACPQSGAWPGRGPDEIERTLKEKLFFFHVRFDAAAEKTRDRLYEIPTTFRLDDDQAEAIEQGVRDIFTTGSGKACVDLLGRIIAGGGAGGGVTVTDNPLCGLGKAAETEKVEKEERQRLQQKR
jgi:predicted acylesterase/phospholipase RssA